MTEAEKFLKNLKIIESTDLTFRCKLSSDNNLINFKIVDKTLLEIMQDFAQQQCKEQFEALQFMTELERTEYIEIYLAERSLNKIN